MTLDHPDNFEPEEVTENPGAQPAPGDSGHPPADAAKADTVNGAPGEQPESDVAAVEQDLAALVEDARSQRDEYLELAQRTKADFDNYRKRMTTESQAAARRGRLDVVGGLIDAIDNLERVLAAAEIDAAEALDGEIPSEAPIADQGVIVAWRDLHTVLRKAEVEVYSPTGEQFDPTYHEALQAIPAEGKEPGTVIEVLQRGYRSGETVLRPARVVVTQ